MPSRPVDLYSRLEPWLGNEQCRTCDCLQGALTQVELDGPGELKEAVTAHKASREEMHPCLGCDPCPPADVWTQYLRRQASS